MGPSGVKAETRHYGQFRRIDYTTKALCGHPGDLSITSISKQQCSNAAVYVVREIKTVSLKASSNIHRGRTNYTLGIRLAFLISLRR